MDKKAEKNISPPKLTILQITSSRSEFLDVRNDFYHGVQKEMISFRKKTGTVASRNYTGYTSFHLISQQQLPAAALYGTCFRPDNPGSPDHNSKMEFPDNVLPRKELPFHTS